MTAPSHPIPAVDTQNLLAENAELRARLDRLETSLHHDSGLFYRLVEQAPIGVYVVDAQFRLQQVNAQALPAFAMVEEPIGRDFGEVMRILWGPEVGAQITAIFRNTLLTGERHLSPRFSEHRHDLAEDKIYEWETQRVTLPNGELGVACYFSDVTEAARAEQALRHSEGLYRAIGESINYGVWVCTPDGKNVYASESFLKLVGLTQEQCSNFGWGEVLHPDDLARTLAAWQECVRTGANWDIEHRFRGVDGQWHHILARGVPVIGPQGTIMSWAGINLDISRLKEAQQALRESEERTRLATEATGVGVWEWNFKTGKIHWDAQTFRIYGLPPTHDGIVPYDTWRQAVLPEDLTQQEEILKKTILGQGPGLREFRIRRPGESACRYIHAVETVRANAQGIAEWLVGTNLDITEQRLAEATLREAKAAAEAANRSKDQFLAALSHELRTPLMPVLITAETLREDLRLPADVREQLTMIERNINLETRLIDDLIDITAVSHGKMQLRAEPVDAHSLIGLAIEMVRDEAATKNIPIERHFNARHSGLTADPARFQQVIWNLLRNAVKFTPPTGTIRISTCDTTGDDGQPGLRVQVADSGIGIEEASLKKIFEPFEQAAATGNHLFGGMGLGLAIARAIVQMHGGKIWAESAGLNRGATITVDFPGATFLAHGVSDAPGEAAPKTEMRKLAEAKSGKLLRLLVVEDHTPTLKVLSTLLTRSGYEISTAGNVAEALTAAAAGTFDLVISDLGLPDGTGIQLMEKLRALYGLRGIALSGYGMGEDMRRTQEAGFVAHLIKPVRIAELRTVLAGLS